MKRGLVVSVVDEQGRKVEGRVETVSGEALRVSKRGVSQEIPVDRIVRIDRPDSLRMAPSSGSASVSGSVSSAG